MCVNYVFCVVFYCWMAPDGRWCCQMIFGRPDIAGIMQLLEDGERLRMVARRHDVSPSIVIQLWRSYQESGEYTRRQDQGRSRMTTPIQDHYLVLRSLLDHTCTARALEINFRHAAEVHLPYQTLRNRLNDDCTRARRPARGPVLTAQHSAMRINFAREHQNRQHRH